MDFPDESGPEQPDLSPVAGPGYALGNDADALRKIRRRTKPTTKLILVGLTLLVVAIGVFMWSSYRQNSEQEALVNQAGDFEPGSPEMLASLREAWPQVTSPEQRLRVVRNLYEFGDAEAGSIFVQGLETPGGTRRFAALGLARLGGSGPEGARGKLLEVLNDSDPLVDRSAVSWALATYGEQQAADVILADFIAGRYQDDDEIKELFDPALIAAALGPQRLGSDELLTHEEAAVRLLTAQALAETASPAVIGPLSRLIDGELAKEAAAQSTEVIREAAAGLGRTGDPAAAAPLFRVLQAQPSLQSSVLSAIEQSTGAPQIATLYDQAQDAGVKRALAGLLADTHDERAADKLAGLLSSNDEETRSTAAVALSELGDARALPTLLSMVESEDSETISVALEAIERIGSPDAARGLLQLFPRSCPGELGPDSPSLCFSRAQMLSAMAASGDPSVGSRIEAELSSVDGPVAALALARLGYGPAYSRLLGMVERPANVEMGATSAADRSLTNEDTLRRRKGAILAMGRYGRPDAADALMTVVEDNVNDDYELRSLAAQSLGMVATPAQIATVIQKVQNPSVPEDTRYYYVQTLWQKPHPELAGELLSLLSADVPGAMQRAAALALGYTAATETDSRLVALLENEDTRAEAGFAIILGGSVESANALADAIESDRNAQQDLQQGLTNESNDWFNQLTETMFSSGQVWKRLEVARTLRERRFPYAWNKALDVLRSGWDGIGGVSTRQIRTWLYNALTGDDPARRRLAAEVLASLPERGLLIRARDQAGNGSEEARGALLGSYLR